MTKRAFFLLGLLLLSLTLAAEERNPPPDFLETGHKPPEMTQPLPDGPWAQRCDLAVFVVLLGTASWLALKSRSRRKLVWLSVLSLAYLGFWKKGCICSIGAIQNVALAFGDTHYLIPLAALLFFLLPLAVTLFFGRTFCAGVCPFGALQDLVALKPVRVPVWLDQALGLLPFVYLGAAVLFAATGSAFIICEYDPFIAFFRLDGSAPMLVLGFALLLGSVFVGRLYCRYVCPYGALLGVFARFTRWHVAITPNNCVDCRLCEQACPYGAILPPVAEKFRPEARDRRRLLGLIVLLPALMLAGGWLVGRVANPLSRMNATVQLAERIALEESGKAKDRTDASDAFRNTGRSSESLYAEARVLRGRFAFGGGVLGAFLGLVLGLKLIELALLRRRADYTILRPACVACGRCFEFCPKERALRGQVTAAQPVAGECAK